MFLSLNFPLIIRLLDSSVPFVVVDVKFARLESLTGDTAIVVISLTPQVSVLVKGLVIHSAHE